jgi:hypothetical protein
MPRADVTQVSELIKVLKVGQELFEQGGAWYLYFTKTVELLSWILVVLL